MSARYIRGPCWSCLWYPDALGYCGCGAPKKVATQAAELKLNPEWLALIARVNAQEIADGRGPIAASKYLESPHTPASNQSDVTFSPP